MLKRLIISFFMILSMVGSLPALQAQQQDPPAGFLSDQCRHICQAYMEKFPQSDLRDLYKFLFQGYFGPEHIISDSMGAVDYINYEIEHADPADWDSPLFYYPVGLLGEYIRVDVNYVRRGIIPMGSMVSALLRSAKPLGNNRVSLDFWKRCWQMVIEQLPSLKPLPGNIEADSTAIVQTLASGNYAVHHSRRYNAAYRQHYRIVRHDIFETELLPFILNYIYDEN